MQHIAVYNSKAFKVEVIWAHLVLELLNMLYAITGSVAQGYSVIGKFNLILHDSPQYWEVFHLIKSGFWSNETVIQLLLGSLGADRAGPDFLAAAGGWLASGGQCRGAAAPPMAAAAWKWGKASVIQPGAADHTHPAGQWDEGGQHFIWSFSSQQCHRHLEVIVCDWGLQSFQTNIMHLSFSFKQKTIRAHTSHTWNSSPIRFWNKYRILPISSKWHVNRAEFGFFFLSVRWRAMLHIFVGCWKSARDSQQNMRETMNTCDMSFTLSDNNKVTIQLKCNAMLALCLVTCKLAWLSQAPEHNISNNWHFFWLPFILWNESVNISTHTFPEVVIYLCLF